MSSLLRTDLALLLIPPLCWLAARFGAWAFLASLPLAALQFLPDAEARIGVGASDAANAAARAVGLVAFPWLFALCLDRARRKQAAMGREVWSGLRAVQIGEFLSFVLYQLREYLISVTSLTEALALSAPKEDAALTEKLGRLKRIVAELNAKAARLLGDRSALTTQSPKEPRPFDLIEFARQAARAADAAFCGAGAPISVVSDGPVGPVACDPRALKACLHAVLQNSLEAGAERAGSLSVVLRQSEDAVQIEVADDAGGIAPRALETIFEPFFSARAAGLGLGLPMSRRLMERMGGSLRVKSKDGRTAVLLELPLKSGLPVIRNEESTWAGRRSRA